MPTALLSTVGAPTIIEWWLSHHSATIRACAGVLARTPPLAGRWVTRRAPPRPGS
mgnify:CR=1 FL=1